MTTVFLMMATALLGVTAAPAVAREARPAATLNSQTSERPQAATRTIKYCVIDTVTGSRIAHKTCKTRDEWLGDGFDPLAKE